MSLNAARKVLETELEALKRLLDPFRRGNALALPWVGSRIWALAPEVLGIL